MRRFLARSSELEASNRSPSSADSITAMRGYRFSVHTVGLIASFATGIANDKGAVHAAITQPWSNGQVEAQITKLKLVKRQMYGRAKLDLLQARLIGAP